MVFVTIISCQVFSNRLQNNGITKRSELILNSNRRFFQIVCLKKTNEEEKRHNDSSNYDFYEKIHAFFGTEFLGSAKTSLLYDYVQLPTQEKNTSFA